jgi:hypothetical protein
MDIRDSCTASPIQPIKCTDVFILCICVYLMWLKICPTLELPDRQIHMGGIGEGVYKHIGRLGAWNWNGYCACTYHIPCDSSRPYTVLASCKKNECHQSINGCVKNDTKGTYLIFLLCRLQINHMKDANCAFMLELGAVVNSPIGYFYLKYLTTKLQLNKLYSFITILFWRAESWAGLDYHLCWDCNFLTKMETFSPAKHVTPSLYRYIIEEGG